MSIIINNIIIANEQGGSQIEQWAEMHRFQVSFQPVNLLLSLKLLLTIALITECRNRGF